MLKVTRDMSSRDVEISFSETSENSHPELEVKAGVGFSHNICDGESCRSHSL